MKVLSERNFWKEAYFERRRNGEHRTTVIAKIDDERYKFYSTSKDHPVSRSDFIKQFYGQYLADCKKYSHKQEEQVKDDTGTREIIEAGAKVLMELLHQDYFRGKKSHIVFKAGSYNNNFISQQYDRYIANCKKEHKHKSSYSFSVQKPKEFDYVRIYREVRKDTPKAVGFILTMPTRQIAVITLYAGFLRQFNAWDNIIVDHKSLYMYWGINATINLDRDFILRPDESSNWRAVRNILVWKKDLPKIREQIKAAIKFLAKPKASVTVEPIEG